MQRLSAAQKRLIGVVAALTVASVAYRVINASDLASSAVLFVGLPAILAIGLALTPPARSVTGMIMKGTTLALLLVGILLIEGAVCILFAAPLFYLVGLVVGLVVDARRRRHPGQLPSPRTFALLLVPLALLSLEGTHELLTLPRDHTVTVERLVDATPAEVEAALAATPRFDGEPPAFLRLGFPTPTTVRGSGLAPDDERAVDFGTGTLRMAVAESRPGFVHFTVVSDDTKLADWIGWQSARVTYADAGSGRTAVRWTLDYERRLDPAWYFGPVERVGATAAAGYLLQELASP